MRGSFSFTDSSSGRRLWTMMFLFFFSWMASPTNSFLTPIGNTAATTPGYGNRICSVEVDGRPTTILSSSTQKRKKPSFRRRSPFADRRRQNRPVLSADEDFISNEPVEKRLLPLVKKIYQCPNARVSSGGPLLLQILKHKSPLQTRWVNNAMKCWRQHPDPLTVAQNSEELLLTMLDLSTEFPSLEPDRYSYGLVMSSWVQQATAARDLGSMERAETHLRNMWARWEETRDSETNLGRQHPGLVSYRRLFQGWLNCADDRLSASQAYRRALSLLKEMSDLCKDGMTEYHTDETFQSPLDYVMYQKRYVLIDDLEVMETMMRLIEDNAATISIEYSSAMRRSLIFAHMRNKELDAQKAMSKIKVLLDEWWEMSHDVPDLRFRLDTRSLNQFIAEAKNNLLSDQALLRAVAMLQEMWQRYDKTGDASIKPDQITYGTLLTILSKSNVENAGEEAEMLLQEMWKVYNEDKIKHQPIKPNEVVYGSVIQVWSKCKDRDSGERAEKLLKEMWERYHNGDQDFKPTTVHYNQVISAMSSGHSEGVTRAESLLREMWERYDKTRDKSIRPDEVTYNSLLMVLSNSHSVYAGSGAQKLLRDMWSRYNEIGDESIKPTRVTYNTLITVFSKSRVDNPGEKAEELLRELWHRYHDTGDTSIRPDKITYNSVLATFSKGNMENASLRAQELLQEMWDRHDQTGDEWIKPDKVTYSSVITVLSKNRIENFEERAEELLQEMWDRYDSDNVKNRFIKPNMVVYSAVIQVWYRNHKKEAGNRAERLLRDMWDRYNAGDEDLKPSNIHLNQVVFALSRVDDHEEGLERAKSLLREMWDRYDEMVESTGGEITFASLIDALFY